MAQLDATSVREFAQGRFEREHGEKPPASYKPACRHNGGDPKIDKWCRFKGDPFCVMAYERPGS